MAKKPAKEKAKPAVKAVAPVVKRAVANNLFVNVSDDVAAMSIPGVGCVIKHDGQLCFVPNATAGILPNGQAAIKRQL